MKHSSALVQYTKLQYSHFCIFKTTEQKKCKICFKYYISTKSLLKTLQVSDSDRTQKCVYNTEWFIIAKMWCLFNDKSWFRQIPLEVLFICRFENHTDKSFHLLCLQQQLWWERALKTHPLISLTSSPNFVYTSHQRCKRADQKK